MTTRPEIAECARRVVQEGPTVEIFEERSISVFAHERGIGKSFGALAIEVLDEVLGSRP